MKYWSEGQYLFVKLRVNSFFKFPIYFGRFLTRRQQISHNENSGEKNETEKNWLHQIFLILLVIRNCFLQWLTFIFVIKFISCYFDRFVLLLYCYIILMYTNSAVLFENYWLFTYNIFITPLPRALKGWNSVSQFIKTKLHLS
jgi:hypothetical protein